MRRYEVTITDTNGNVVQHWQSHFSVTQSNPGALRIDLDIYLSRADATAGSSKLVVWGLSLEDLKKNYNGMGIVISGGFGQGLPLANPSQYGIIAEGTIYQAFSNWILVDTYITYIFNPPTGTNDNPVNISWNWKDKTPLATAIQNTLSTAFPNVKNFNINVNQNLVANALEPGTYKTLSSFAQYVKSRTQALIGGTYPGVSIVLAGNTLNIYDGTQSSNPKTISILDLIGQPQWIDVDTIQVIVAMRYDINVGDYVMLPNTLASSNEQALISFQDSSIFSGNFIVSQIRQLGSFKEPAGTSWCTILTCIGSSGYKNTTSGSSLST